jgi:transcriptional regulator with XRE-family HTH domain
MVVRAMSITRPKRPHIRLLRRRAGLTQGELAFLLGHRSHSQISRFEHGRRVPAADELLQLEVIFGVVPGGVFPHLRDEAANAVLARIEKLKRVSGIETAKARLDRPSCRAFHLDRILESIRRQQAPGLSAHEPWPTATLASETEQEER